MRKQRQRRFAITATIAAAVVALLVVVIVVLNSNGKAKTATPPTTNPGSTTSTTAGPTTSTSTTTTLPPVSVPLVSAPAKVGCPRIGGTNPHYTKFAAAPPMCIDPSKTYTAKMVTTAGTITIKLPKATADQKTVNNFVFLSSYHFYDGTEFHRIITGFVDQGGDPTGTGSGGPGYAFDGGKPASNKVYTAGALAMANNGGNPATDGSQFFLIVGNGGAGLSPVYSYFGQVTGGMAVVNKINTEGGSATQQGAPLKLFKIKTVTISAS